MNKIKIVIESKRMDLALLCCRREFSPNSCGDAKDIAEQSALERREGRSSDPLAQRILIRVPKKRAALRST